MSEKVIVIGGGLAGLSAACEVVAGGKEVLLLEGRPRVGGRVDSWTDSELGLTIDCGAHVVFSCYDATLRYLKRIEASDRMIFPSGLRIDFRDVPHGKTFTFSARGDAGPADFLMAMRKLPIPIVEKMNLLRMGGLSVSGRHEQPDGLDERSALEWLHSRGQGPRIQEILWNPLCLAALNGEPDRVSGFLFRRVLEEVFFTGRGRARIGKFQGSLRETFIEPALHYLSSHSSEVRTNSRVRRIRFDSAGTAEGVELQDGSIETGQGVICAVPPASMARILQNSGEALVSIGEGLRKIEDSAILTVYVWYDRPLFEGSLRALIGTFSQWVFFGGVDVLPGGEGHRYAVVISAVESGVLRRPAGEIAKRVQDELTQAFPGKNGTWMASRVVKYPYATPLFRPGTYRFRAPVRPSGISGLALAGDHVRIPLPATIESAVRSGQEAAGVILEKE